MTTDTKLYALYLYSLQGSLIFPNIDRVLYPIGEAIAISGQDLETSDQASLPDDYLEAIIEEETDLIENLLGAAFVVCQTYISAVVSRVKALHRLYEQGHKGDTLKTTSKNKWDIVAYGNSPRGTSQYSKVQIIDAFANYFKHREEWPGEWDKLDDRAQKTADIIRQAGAKEGSNGNLRSGAKYLENKTYTDMNVFIEILQSWRQELYNGYRTELESRQLISAHPGLLSS